VRPPAARLKDFAGRVSNGANPPTRRWIPGLCPAAPSYFLFGAMNFSDFLRIECEGRDGSRHTVVHTGAPKFSLELVPDPAAPDKIGHGVIKRLCVPNSWAGDYTQYARHMNVAQEFFARSFAEPEKKSRTPISRGAS